MRYVLGIDVGTTAIKAVLLGEDGAPGPVVQAGYSLKTPAAGFFEQDPDELWGALCRAAQEAAAGREVVGLGLSTQAAALLPLDGDGRPLRSIISWMDQRAQPEAEELSRRLGKEFFASRTGLTGPGLSAPVLRWLKKNEPETLRRAGELLGFLLPAAAESLGVAPRAPVALAAHDQYAAALGAGIVAPGSAMLSTGTAWVILAISGQMDRARAGGLFLAPHLTGNGWGALGVVPAGNGYYDRARELFGLNDYRLAEQEAAASGPGARGLLFIPVLGGRREAAWTGLGLKHVRGDLLRAVMEGLVLEAAYLLEEMKPATGYVGEITMLGGAAKSCLWGEIAATLLERRVRVPEVRDAAALGAALLGGLVAGWWRDLGEGYGRVPTAVQCFDPAPETCRELLARYREARARFAAPF